MEIEKAVVGPLFTNCYILSEKDETVVIDPGGEPEKIFSLLSSPLSHIILTHAHPDHLGALSALKNEFPKAKFLLHQADSPLLKKFLPAIKPGGFLKEGKYKILNTEYKILHTPGHSPGGICLLEKDFIFTGDTLFAQGVGRTDFPYGDEKQLLQSLKKLSKLPGSSIIYPGHGEISTLKQALEPLSGLLEGY